MLDSWIEWLEIDEACPECEGKRLNPEALAVRWQRQEHRRLCARSRSTQSARQFFEQLALQGREAEIARDIVAELNVAPRLPRARSASATSRSTARAPTLSGGEAQRIRLAAQLGSNLRGVCYILDEPTIGLHPRDNQILLDMLEKLERQGQHAGGGRARRGHHPPRRST